MTTKMTEKQKLARRLLIDFNYSLNTKILASLRQTQLRKKVHLCLESQTMMTKGKIKELN